MLHVTDDHHTTPGPSEPATRPGRPGVKDRVTRRKVAACRLHREPADHLVVGGLGLTDGQAGVDLERLSAGVPGIGLDQGVVEALVGAEYTSVDYAARS